jgi:oligopeptidase B
MKAWPNQCSKLRSLVFAAISAALLAACAQTAQVGSPDGAAPALSTASIAPPIAAKKPYTVESPNGNRIDNYYWLRDDTRKSPEMLAYLEAENAYRDQQLAHTAALQQKLYDEMVARLKPDDASVATLDHGYWYYTRFESGKEYPVYARRKGSFTAPEEVMLDGNAMAAGKSFFQIGDTAVSPNGKLLAYAVDEVGRRQYTLKIKNLETGETLPDTVADVEPNLVWANDNKTVLYVEKDPITLLSVRVHRHPLGSDAKRDPLVYEEKDHTYYMGIGRSKSDRYLFIQLQSTLQTEVRYAAASDPKLRFKPVLPREANLEYQAENIGNDFVIRTNWQAPNFRVVRVPVAKSADKKAWKDVIPQRSDSFVQSFEVFKDYLAINERNGGLLKLRARPWKAGKDIVIDADQPSYSMSLVETPELDNQKLRYVYTSMITPRTTYDYDLKTGARELLKTDTVLGGFDSANYTTEYVHATARDGTSVPISLAYRKGTKLDGTAPLYQYAYGSYGISTDPGFRSNWVSLLDRGFVVAIANIRGGQELGRDWYENGKLLRKMNTFTDFIDCTRWLVTNHYGAKDKVFAEGRSAGGLLMGAVANLAPQDYRGIIAGVPFVDVVTTMLDESIPLTTNEFDEWGNPKMRAFYHYMLSYSPYDNVKPQAYPAMIVSTGLWDSQVQYYEPAKWVAKLRATKTDSHPLIFSIDMAAGHGGKSGRFQKYHDTAREYAFVFDQIGITQ